MRSNAGIKTVAFFLSPLLFAPSVYAFREDYALHAVGAFSTQIVCEELFDHKTFHVKQSLICAGGVIAASLIKESVDPLYGGERDWRDVVFGLSGISIAMTFRFGTHD